MTYDNRVEHEGGHTTAKFGELTGLCYKYERISDWGGIPYHYCGYLEVPKTSVLHNVPYDASLILPEPFYNKLMETPIGKRGPIEILCMAASKAFRVSTVFNVHGSITFSGLSSHMKWNILVPDGWYVGFDCAHCDDHPSIQDTEYVLAELDSLAEQIDVFDKIMRGEEDAQAVPLQLN